MKFNKIRILLIVCNVLFLLLGAGMFAIFVPGLNNLVIEDAKQELNNNVIFVTDAIRNNSVKYNYGLTVYTIPRDSQRKLKTDMYSFYIIDQTGVMTYTSNPRFDKTLNYLEVPYIARGFTVQDNNGETTGVLGNRIHYITTRVIVRNEPYLLVYEIDVDKIKRDVLLLISIMMSGYFVAVFIVGGLSIYIDRQYSIIYHFRENLLDTYKLLDDGGTTTDYLKRIKKVLHAFSFTTANLMAVNDQGQLLFRNRAFLDSQTKWLGARTRLAEFNDDEPIKIFIQSWRDNLIKLLASQDNHIEWFVDTKDISLNRFYSFNRAKKIHVEDALIIICEVQDITDTMNAKDDVEKYTEYLETILNTVHDVILTTDNDGLIVDANNAVKIMFGYDLSDLKGKPITTLVDGNRQVLNEHHIMCDGMKADGTKIRCELYQNNLELPHQRVMQLYVIQDVTEREYLKEKLYASIALTTETMQTIAGNM